MIDLELWEGGGVAMEREPHPCCDATATNIFGEMEAAEFYAKHRVGYVEDTLVNSRGLRQCWRSWVPVEKDVRGVVCVCHGYGADSGWLVQLTCIAIAKEGYAVYAIDHQGHGKSEGLKGHIPDLNAVVGDCIAFFDPKVSLPHSHSLCDKMLVLKDY